MKPVQMTFRKRLHCHQVNYMIINGQDRKTYCLPDQTSTGRHKRQVQS